MIFEIPGRPQGKARPRVTKRGAYTPQRTREYEARVKAAYIEAGSKAFTKDEPVRVDILAFYAIPKRTSKRDRERMLAGKIKPTVKPDCDNVAKIICDALNGLAYHDDNQIVQLTVTKRYSDRPRVTVLMVESHEEFML